MEKKRQPIGVFDSGAGGLSVLKELVRLMPEEDFIYYGDSLNAPYGVKPLEEVRQLTYACAEHLLERGVKEIIIACNTATSAACKIMRGHVSRFAACRNRACRKAGSPKSPRRKGGCYGNSADTS